MPIRKKIHTLFLRMDRIFKIDTTYLAKGSFWLTMGQASSSVAALFMAIVFANFLPKETYGTYKYILSIISILTVTTLPGIGSALTQAIAEGKEGTLIPALRTRLKYGLLGGVAAIGIAIFEYGWGNNNTLTIAFCIVALFLPLMDPLGMYGIYLHSKKEFKRSAIYFISSQAIVVTALFITTITTKNIITILTCYLITWTATRGFFFWRAVKSFPPNNIKSPETLPFGLHISAMNMVGQIAESIDSLLLFNFLGSTSVAIYSVAASPTEQIRSLFKNIPTIAIPKLAKRSIDEINSVLLRRMIILFTIGLILAIIFIVLLPFLFSLVYTQYTDAVRYAQWYAPTLALRLPLSFLNAVTQSKLTQFKKGWLYFGMLPNIVLILTLIVIVPTYGIVGVIFCRYINLILTFGTSTFQWRLLTKRMQQNLV